MYRSKIKSFTLSEMLVVLIITAIVVGLGFSILRLVQKEVSGIEKNVEKATALSLFSQRLKQDFDRATIARYSENTLTLFSSNDTLHYFFSEKYILREADTTKLHITIDKMYLLGSETNGNRCDAIKFSAVKEIPDYYIFANTNPDASFYLNQNGF